MKIIVMIAIVLFSMEVFSKPSRKPASEEYGLLIEYSAGSKTETLLSINTYPYGNYADFEGVDFNCTQSEYESATRWDCVSDDQGGTMVLEFKRGFKRVRVLEYRLFKACVNKKEICEISGKTRKLKFKKASISK